MNIFPTKTVTAPLEASLLYKDNLHFSEKGLRQVSGIILSNFYQVLAPNSYKLRLSYI